MVSTHDPVVSTVRLLLEEEDAARTAAHFLECVVELSGAESGFIVVRQESGSFEQVFEVGGSAPRAPLERRWLAGTESAQLFGPVAVLVAPLRAREEVWGVVYLENRRDLGAFQPERRHLVETLAELAGLSRVRASRAEMLRRRNESLEDELFARYDFQGIGARVSRSAARPPWRQRFKGVARIGAAPELSAKAARAPWPDTQPSGRARAGHLMSLVCPECGWPSSELDPLCLGCGTPLPTSTESELAHTPLTAGGRLDRFEILGELGAGGMGVVYRARDLELHRDVALKLLRGDADRERVLREARAVAALDHPAIGTLYEVGSASEGPFLVLALYQGRTLAEELRERGALPPVEALEVAHQLAGALAAAHAAGILHRDVKPSNVFRLADGRIKLLDFGIALAGVEGTAGGARRPVGTPAYMAPERLRGEESGAAGDVWSFGVVGWEMLNGERPCADVGIDRSPPALEPLLRGCLAPEPGARPSAAELEHRLGAMVEALRRRPAARVRQRLAAVLVVVMAVVAAVFLWLRPARPIVVTVLEPKVSGALAAGDRERLAANLEATSWRTLLRLEGVEPLDRALARQARGEPAAVARATAADETIGWEASCPGVDLCTVRLLRRTAQGRVLGSETLELSAAGDTLSARAAAAALHRVYPELRAKSGESEPEPSAETYRRYLELRSAIDRRELAPEAALGELEALRTGSPALPELSALEAGICRYLLARDRDEKWLERGLAAVDAGLSRTPGHSALLATRFDLLLAAGRQEEARTALSMLEGSGAGLAEVLIRRARLAEAQGRPEEALGVLRRLAEDRPAVYFLLTLANLEQRLGRTADARHHLEQALERAPDNAQARAQLAGLDLVEGRLEPAAAGWRLLAEKAPTPDALDNYGLVLMLSRRYQEAEPIFRRALALSPGHAETQLNLADTLSLLGRETEALGPYRGLVVESSGGIGDSWQLWAVRAQAHAHLGESAAARTAVGEMLRRAPESGEAALSAALVFTLLGEPGSALEQARRASVAGNGGVWLELPFFDPLAVQLEAAGLRQARNRAQG